MLLAEQMSRDGPGEAAGARDAPAHRRRPRAPPRRSPCCRRPAKGKDRFFFFFLFFFFLRLFKYCPPPPPPPPPRHASKYSSLLSSPIDNTSSARPAAGRESSTYDQLVFHVEFSLPCFFFVGAEGGIQMWPQLRSYLWPEAPPPAPEATLGAFGTLPPDARASRPASALLTSGAGRAGSSCPSSRCSRSAASGVRIADGGSCCAARRR